MTPVQAPIQTLSKAIESELRKGSDISIIALLDALINHAHMSRASDIHIDPLQNEVRVRLRIDGVLKDAHTIPKAIHGELVSRIKVLAGLRTDEHQVAQDGRLRHRLSEVEEVDIRVSIIPTYHGETGVLRLLSSRKGEDFSLDNFGFNDKDKEKILAAVKRPSGMILSTGPTGSGKTTTLYTLLRLLNTDEVSIVTIEDPIEYAMSGIKQIQVNSRTGLSFATGLRSILRQDPNIIMVGEIRDAETAAIAVNTALTGHLLLSTLHTNDAATTLPRLRDMGVDAYLIASTISIAIAQRLLRQICTNCREEIKITKAHAETLAHLPLKQGIKEGETFYKGKGCDMCQESGYVGRVCINEVISADDDIRDAIMREAPSSEIKKIAMKNGMTTMLEDGIKKARKGLTTIEEVLRVVHE